MLNLATIAILLAGAGGASIGGEPVDQSTGRDWYWCQLAERPYGRTVFVSEVFAPPAGASEPEIEATFEEHVQRRYVGQPVAGGLCLGPAASREDAQERRRDVIRGLRRDGVTVVRTDWPVQRRRSESE